MSTIRFIYQKKEIETPQGTLADACAKAGYPLNLVCGGKGTCGKCRVKVRLSDKAQEDVGKAQEITEVLACQTPADQVSEVYLEHPEELLKANILTSLGQVDENRTLSSSVKKRYTTLAEFEPEEGQGYLEEGQADLHVMRRLSAIVSREDLEGCTLVCFDSGDSRDRIIDIQPGDVRDFLFGAAIDIGTTTVVLYLYDLNSGKLLSTQSSLNRQIIHGADVITRITYSSESEAHLKDMQYQIKDTIKTLLEKAYRDGSDNSNLSYDQIQDNLYHMVLCGNSTMQHLFFGLNPKKLGASPFANITMDRVLSNGVCMGFPVAHGCQVEFLPLLGSFVGADTTAAMLNLSEKDKTYLMIDLGTNGEIAVGNEQGFLVASTACGPALEGGNISCGMRGSEGAVEKVRIEEDKVLVRVIGSSDWIQVGGKDDHSKNIRGICGSGIIDIMACLLKVGIVDEQGTMLSKEEYQEAHPSSLLAERIQELEEYNQAFYLTDQIYFSQKDVRQIQLAKSSIYSGSIALVRQYQNTRNDNKMVSSTKKSSDGEKQDITLKGIDYLVLAGAFGNYIDIDNALLIGLLPKMTRNYIISIGNGAGNGVRWYLTDSSYRDKVSIIKKNTRHVELANDPYFMDDYIMNMIFSS